MRVLVDWSTICYQNWHKIKSPNYEAKTDIEQEEFSRNMAKTIVYYIARFKPTEMVFARDGLGYYWRHKKYTEYYRKHTEWYEEWEEPEHLNPVAYYMEYDYKIYKLEYHEAAKKWIKSRFLTIAQKEVLALQKTKGEVTHTKHEDVPKELHEFYLTYKGNRGKDKWDYTTSYSEFKELCSNIAYQLANTVKAKVIFHIAAEADDVAWAYHHKYPDEETIFITTDSDWPQLKRETMFSVDTVKLFNPLTMKWYDETMAQTDIALATKIIGGDSGDNIKAIKLKTGKTTMSKAKAEEMVLKAHVPGEGNGCKGVYDWLSLNAVPHMLKKNYQLIYLANMPKNLKKDLKQLIEQAKIRTDDDFIKIKDYGVDMEEKLATKALAEQDRGQDIVENRYSV